MYATVAEIKAVLPAGLLTDDEIQDILDVAAVDTGENHKYHFNKAVSLAITKLRLAGSLPDSATVGPLKVDNDITNTLASLTNDESRLPFLYYKRVGSNDTN